MAGSNLNIEFTNDKYLNRFQVAEELGTSLIDHIWRDILLYRRGMSVTLPIIDNAKFNYTLTQTPKVISLFGDLSSRINTCINAYDKLMNGSIAKYTLTHDMLKASLKAVAKQNGLDASEITLQNIIEHQCYDQAYQVVINYYNALERLSKATYEQVSEDFLATYYAVLTGQEELTSFYRVYDSDSPSSRYLVGAEYDDGVPVGVIEELTNKVIAFATDKDIPVLTRVVGTIYMFNYIKPFDKCNTEMGILAAKSILANSGLSVAAVYVPIEQMILDKDLFGSICREVQKSRDFTYFFLKGSDDILNSFSVIIDRIIQVNAKALENTMNVGDDVKKFKEEFGFEPEKGLIDEVKPEPIFEQPVVEEVLPIKPAPAPKAPAHEQTPVAPAPAPVIKAAPPAKFDNKPISDLSEKELKARELDILESDPYIKKGQAHFYVRHCTKGRFYTIQEYKKFEGCVYETARTSMDNLAMRGYYRREQIKNKFVYTPIDKE